MGQFIAPRGQQLPVTIADVKNRIRRAEHKIEALQAASGGTDTGGIEVTFSATLPDSANVGDVWYQTSGNSVIAAYQCVTKYASGAGVQGDWTDYTTDGSSLTNGTVTSTQIAAEGVAQSNLASDITARTLGGNIVTIGETEPSGALDGDTWIEVDGSNDITSIWTYNGGAWVESTIAISAGGIEVTASTTAPVSPNTGDLWINESEGNLLEQWNGSSWVAYQYGSGAIANGAVGNSQLASNAVGTSNIQSGAVTNTQLNGSVTARSIGGNQIFVSAALPSSPLLNDEWIQTDGSTNNTIGIYTYGTNQQISPAYVGDAETTAAALGISVPVIGPVNPGSTIIVTIVVPNTTSQTITVSDTQSNTYTSSSAVTGTGMQQKTFTSANSAGMTTTDSITIISTVSEQMTAVVLAVPGSASVTGTTTGSGSSTAPSVTTSSATVTGEVQLVLYANVSNQTITAAPSGYTTIGHYQSSAVSLAVDAVWQLTTASGAHAVTAALATSGAWTAVSIAVPYTVNSWNSSLALNASEVIAAGTINAELLAAGSVVAGTVAAGALDGITVNAPTINSSTINASDFIIAPGADNGIYAYGSLAGTSITTFSTAGSGTWTAPQAGTLVIETWAAGGGGGSGDAGTGNNLNYGGGGGGGGEYAKATVSVTSGLACTYTIGAGGAGGIGNPSSAGHAGTAGGNTTFTAGSTVVTAHGGSGGAANASPATGGAGGTGSTATTHYKGGAGGATAHSAGAGGGGSGGNSSAGGTGYAVSSSLGTNSGAGASAVAGGGPGGAGSALITPAYNGVTGGFPGGGGGGGASSQTNPPYIITNGGNGAQGSIKLTFTVSGGTPAVLASVCSVPGTDPFGSTVHDGFTAYNGSAYVQLHVNSAQDIPAIELHSGNVSEADAPAVYNIPINPGAVNESSALVFSGPGSSYDDMPPAMWMVSSAKDGSGTGYLAFGLNGTNALNMYLSTNGFHMSVPLWGQSGNIICGDIVTAQLPGGASNTPETWHKATYATNWSDAGTGLGLYYKFTPDNYVELHGQIVTSAAIASGSSSTVCTLPAGYRPANRTEVGTAINGETAASLAHLTTAGVFAVYGPCSATTTYQLNVRFPLDVP